MQVDLDLPGYEDEDGIALPYIVTIEQGTQTILSIRRNWRPEDETRQKRNHFVHYGYVPGFGFYCFGLIHLVGAFAKSGTSLIRQLVDAGTLSNLPGGFKARGMRVLVTTLTKRMAEDLTEFLHEAGLRVRYMHSDVETLERIELIRDLRLGVYDVLVGINLLREGLDIPECGLVAILDADKEGFLRSETSLIQTIGRAARNLRGKAILYADKITPSMRAAMGETADGKGWGAQTVAVHAGELKLVVKVGHGAHTAHHHGGVVVTHKVTGQAGEGHHFHLGVSGHCLTRHVHTLVQGEQGFLVVCRGHRQDNFVKHGCSTQHDVFMAQADGVKGAGVNGNNLLGHGRSYVFLKIKTDYAIRRNKCACTAPALRWRCKLSPIGASCWPMTPS
jgi:hypothetical protein